MSGVALGMLEALVSSLAALGGIVAIIIAVRALTVARESSAVEQLFAAFGDVLVALQEVGSLGSKLGQTPGGEVNSRETISGAFERFLAARARADLALESLGLAGDYPSSVLDIANNFAADVTQADEFAALRAAFTADDLVDRSWVTELSWSPSSPDVEVLAQSASFQGVRHSLELVSEGVTQLVGLDKWWGDRILEHDHYRYERSVYSIHASYLTQTARLLDDFTREYVQPMFSAAVRRVARSHRRLRPLK